MRTKVNTRGVGRDHGMHMWCRLRKPFLGSLKVIGSQARRWLPAMAEPSLSAGPSSLSVAEKKELITRNLEVRTRG